MHLVYYFAALVVLPALSSSVDDGLRAVLFGGVRAGKPEHTKLCVATLNYFSPFFLISTTPCDGT